MKKAMVILGIKMTVPTWKQAMRNAGVSTAKINALYSRAVSMAEPEPFSRPGDVLPLEVILESYLDNAINDGATVFDD